MIHIYIGWVGAILFGICAIPQVMKTWKTKKAGDLSWWFLIFWLFGELLTFTYILIDDNIHNLTHWPLYINYGANFILVFYLIYAKKYYD